MCAYEKVCAYKKGALNNPSLRYVTYFSSHSLRQIVAMFLKTLEADGGRGLQPEAMHSLALVSKHIYTYIELLYSRKIWRASNFVCICYV